MNPVAIEKLNKLKSYIGTHKKQIREIVREPTAGGIIFRRNADGEVELLLVRDLKERWTILKGHIEEGERGEETAIREIAEESGLKNVKNLGYLGKIDFRFRRANKLVLMTTQIYLIKAVSNTNAFEQKEEWMTGIQWFKFNDALEAVEYEDIEKLMLLAMKRIRQENL